MNNDEDSWPFLQAKDTEIATLSRVKLSSDNYITNNILCGFVLKNSHKQTKKCLSRQTEKASMILKQELRELYNSG
jgi:hypothetical protein